MAKTRLDNLFNLIVSEDYQSKYNNRKDIKLITKTDNFSEVNIINDEGEIIGVENIRRTVDKYNYGMVLFSKGKKSKSIEAGGEWFEYNKLCFIEDYFFGFAE